MCRIPIDCCFWSSCFFLQNFRQIGLFPFPVLILLILMTIWLYVWYVCKSVKPAGFHCDDILSALVTLFSWVVKALNMSGFFYQDVFGPMPTDWLFPDRSRLAKVVESWVKEGGGVAALRRSPPRSAAGRRRLPRRRAAAAAAGLRRGEAQGGGHELCTYVHRIRSVLVLACPYLLARAAACCAAPRPLRRAAASRCPTAQRCAVGRPSR